MQHIAMIQMTTQLKVYLKSQIMPRHLGNLLKLLSQSQIQTEQLQVSFDFQNGQQS